MSSHEPLRVHRKVRPTSDRWFGLVIAAAFILVGLLPLLRGGEVRWWAAVVAAAFAAVALIRPVLLGPANRRWFALGKLLHAVVSPVLMALLFFGAVTPVALMMRRFGKDPLRLEREERESYWIARDPPGPKAGTMSKQF